MIRKKNLECRSGDAGAGGRGEGVCKKKGGGGLGVADLFLNENKQKKVFDYQAKNFYSANWSKTL